MIEDGNKAKKIDRMFVREFKHYGKAITTDALQLDFKR